MTNLTVLDCTIRDGGYYNNWDFSTDFVNNYLKAIAKTNINVVEIGFRELINKEFCGPFFYSTENYLNHINFPKNLKIAVMVNAKTIINVDFNNVFCHKDNSKIDIIRIATTLDTWTQCKKLITFLKNNKYKICLNIMQSHNCDFDKLNNLIEELEFVDVLYFADSFGCMSPDSVSHLISVVRNKWTGEIGFHAHDNQNCAIANTLAAMKTGATWLDSTVCGMGRGAGNAQTEYLLLNLNKLHSNKYNVEELYQFILEYVDPLKQTYKWGQNLLYYLAANYQIHPTYIQEIITGFRYSPYEILNAIKKLGELKPKNFNSSSLKEAANVNIQVDGSRSIDNWLSGQNVLILGSGPSREKYLNDIYNFITTKNVFVISLNYCIDLPINAYAVCHPTRLITDIDKYTELNAKLILPIKLLSEIDKAKLNDFIDYGLFIQKDKFDWSPTNCTVPYLLVAAYALAFASQAGAKNIYLAGFDGYSITDSRQEEMRQVFKLYQENNKACPIFSLTPCSYNVPYDSLFGDYV